MDGIALVVVLLKMMCEQNSETMAISLYQNNEKTEMPLT